MLLGCQLLENLQNVNNYREVQNLRFSQGDGPSIYLQLLDLTQKPDGRIPGLRYMPATGATLECQVQNINDAVTLDRFATQPFSQDPSIWLLQLLPTDTISGTANIRLTLREPLRTLSGILKLALRIDSNTNLDGVLPTPAFTF